MSKIRLLIFYPVYILASKNVHMYDLFEKDRIILSAEIILEIKANLLYGCLDRVVLF